MSIEKAKSLANALTIYQFLYATLMQVFASKSFINKISKIHFRALQILYSAYDKSYKELPAFDGVSIIQEHLPILAIQVCQYLTKRNSDFM